MSTDVRRVPSAAGGFALPLSPNHCAGGSNPSGSNFRSLEFQEQKSLVGRMGKNY